MSINWADAPRQEEGSSRLPFPIIDYDCAMIVVRTVDIIEQIGGS